MKKDIILAGVGGQGILTIAATLGLCAVEEGLYIKQSEVHGMSQRGGDVQSHVRLSDKPISSDLIPFGKADMIISVEPMESLRYLPMLNPEKGWLITNSKPFVNISDYPDMDNIFAQIDKVKNHIVLDAEQIAKDVGSPRAANIVILGAASPFLDLEYELIEVALKKLFGKKGEDVVNLNLAALKAGYDFATSRI
jgi:indolepyruvate ferredoxin oxidoreductase beta subunit